MNWKNCTAAGMFVLAGMVMVGALQTASAAVEVPKPDRVICDGATGR